MPAAGRPAASGASETPRKAALATSPRPSGWAKRSRPASTPSTASVAAERVGQLVVVHPQRLVNLVVLHRRPVVLGHHGTSRFAFWDAATRGKGANRHPRQPPD